MIETPEIRPRGTLFNIQALRAIAALLVVFAHLPGIEAKHSPDQILPGIFQLGIAGVDMFFVISGFIMVYVTTHLQPGIQTAARFLFSRISRIYPIYWVIAGLVFAAWKISPGLISFDPAQTSILKSFLLWPQESFPMLKVAWTLIHELYFYAVFALCLFLPAKFRAAALTLWAGAILAAALSGVCPVSPEMRLVLNPMGLEFYLGALIGWIYARGVDDYGRLALGVGVLCLMAALSYQSSFAFDPFPSDGRRVIIFGLPSVLIVYGLTAMERKGRQSSKRLAAIGDWSYSLYLSHVLTLSLLGYAWHSFASGSLLDNLPVLLAMTMLSVAAGGFLWHGVERPLLRIFAKLRDRIFGPS